MGKAADKRALVDSGFGEDVATEKKVSVETKALKLMKISCAPMFSSCKEPTPCKYNKINGLETCMCGRLKQCGDAVMPEGPLDAKYVFVGRDPGEVEVENKRPFHPDAPGGGLFMQYLEILGLDRSQCYITNCLFCRAPNNAPPTASELHACMHFHIEEFKDLKKVKYIFPMGSHAFQMMTSIVSSVTPFVGSYIECDYLHFGKITVVPTHHPGYLLRKPSEQTKFLEILEKMSVK